MIAITLARRALLVVLRFVIVFSSLNLYLSKDEYLSAIGVEIVTTGGARNFPRILFNSST